MNDRYRDPLDLLTEEDLRKQAPELVPVAIDPWWERFQYHLYDWDDPDWKRQNTGPYAWLPIRMTQGYFFAVSIIHYDRMSFWPDGTKRMWRPKIDRSRQDGTIIGVHAARRGRGEEPDTVYAHRELLGILEYPHLIGEHSNGWGLDNRMGTKECPVVLRATGQSENVHNSVRTRRKHIGLPRGVEPRGNGRFGGIMCKRLGKHRVRVIRSKRTWATPEKAAPWYQNRLKRMFRKRTAWAHVPHSAPELVFPPLRRAKGNTRSRKKRDATNTKAPELAEVPF